MSDIERALDRIAARRPRLIDLSLDRVYAALARLGDPHRSLPPVFHVAGTNGKGSTVAFLRAMLEAAGKRLHIYTSPHLVRFNERIVLAGGEVDDATLIDALNAVDEAVGDDRLTYFETITCAAFLLFSRQQADYLLLEVGLGGRLDATNVLDAPLASVITPVDYDHQKFLGSDLAGIASEKAGIFRRAAPAVIGRQSPAAFERLMKEAEKAGAPIYAMGREWDAFAERGRLIFQDERGLLDLDPPRLAGAHQIENAGLAVAALRATGVDISGEALSAGVAGAHWPARLQRLTSGPLADIVARSVHPHAELWLDGGHNPHAGRAIARALADMEARAPRPLFLIAGMQANKDAAGYFASFAGLARQVLTVAADSDGVASAQAVAEAAREAGLVAEPASSAEAALREVLGQHAEEPPRIVLCGSLYLAGEILRDNA